MDDVDSSNSNAIFIEINHANQKYSEENKKEDVASVFKLDFSEYVMLTLETEMLNEIRKDDVGEGQLTASELEAL